MWNTLGELVAELGGAAAGDQAALPARTFGPLSFVHLQRRDRVAQAVSRHRAEASGTWHLGFEEAEHPVEPRYDFAQIGGYLAEAQGETAAWEGWFAANAITPLRVAYEDLAADPVAVAGAVLDYLGLTALHPVGSPVQRMADATRAAWVVRFRAEAGLAAG